VKTTWLQWAKSEKQLDEMLKKGWRVATHQQHNWAVLMEFKGENPPK
jgi:hypothetical protein